MTCTFSIECSTILNNWNDLKESKAEFVPADGWILYPSEVEFYEGETVFDVLKRVCNEAGIQMESEWTPMYNSYYVSGINNLYELTVARTPDGCTVLMAGIRIMDAPSIRWKTGIP